MAAVATLWFAAVGIGICLLPADVETRSASKFVLPVEMDNRMKMAEDTGDVGYFWHVADMHWDPTYAMSNRSGVSCGSGAPSGDSLGQFGDYACDSPWTLIDSSIDAMYRIRSDVDFVIWTGDDTPHLPQNYSQQTEDEVATIISNLTDRLRQSFVNESLPIYAVLGNHDWTPKHQLPPRNHPLYDRVADMWHPRLMDFDNAAQETFRKSGYYSLRLSAHLFVVGLNTNLYYKNDQLTDAMPDPGNQLQWLDDTLTSIRNNGSKAILIGHVPPGVFEKHLNWSWYRPHYNQLFAGLLRKHSDVIGSAHFAHHHTDTFRLVRSETGDAVTSLLIAPAVTPWETTLAGVMGGAGNNPCVRLVKYDRVSGHVMDIEQYFLNLTAANAAGTANWTLEYRFTEYFGSNDVTTAALDRLADQLLNDENQFSRYYKINDAFFPKESTGNGNTEKSWTDEERTVHCCAVSYVDYSQYDGCVRRQNPTTEPPYSVARSTMTEPSPGGCVGAALRNHVTAVAVLATTICAIAGKMLLV